MSIRILDIERLGTASILSGALALTLTSAALAAPTTVSRAPAKVADVVADVGQGHVATVNDGENDAGGACAKARKRLWVEGEGWIVRKVTTCR